jgi:hypothetical protein
MIITEKDFDQLSSTSMLWAGTDWKAHIDRFDKGTLYDWKVAYWFDDMPHVIFAKNFLTNLGFPFQETYDYVLGERIILTNYLTPSWISEKVSA